MSLKYSDGSSQKYDAFKNLETISDKIDYAAICQTIHQYEVLEIKKAFERFVYSLYDLNDPETEALIKKIIK